MSILIAILAAGCLSVSPGEAETIATNDAERLANCWFGRPYSYMFNLESPRPLEVNGTAYGQFSAASKGLLYYGDAYQCVADMKGFTIGNPWSHEDTHGALELILKNLGAPPLYLDDSKREPKTAACGLKDYNPEAIGWMARWIPAQGDQIGGHTAERVYQSVFSRFVRMMAESYVWLRSQEDLQKEQGDYCAMVVKSQSKDWDGATLEGSMLHYLEQRYKDALPDYALPPNGTDFLPEYAVGFWIRRSLDGTEAAFWDNVLIILRRFDAKWLAEKSKANQEIFAPRP